MRTLWLYAHPEPLSLNASLRDAGLAALRERDATYQISDLYAMHWDPVLSRTDVANHAGERFHVAASQRDAYLSGDLSADIRAEQEKLRWADTVIVQYPLWWAGMPAILKGWFDRVFTHSFAFGVKNSQGHTLRYGDGGLAGKRAMAVVSYGSRETHMGPRGIDGDADELMFGVNHGMFWYTGMEAMPTLYVPSADRISGDEFDTYTKRLRERLHRIDTDDPIPYRYQDGGDYDTDATLRPELAPHETGLRAHFRSEALVDSKESSKSPGGPARLD